jgi:hypothetical protein
MADVTFTAVTQPAPACYPPDVNALLTLIATLGLRGTIPDNSGGGIFVGSSQPSSSLTNKVWLQVDAAGRPIGFKVFYNGNWRFVQNARYGDLRMSAISIGSDIDGNGLGVIGGLFDGWAFCDGRNGTPDLRNRFPVMCDNGSTLTTNVDPTNPNSRVGGAPNHVIQRTNLPHMQTKTLQKGFSYANGATGGNELYQLGSETVFWPVVDSGGLPVGGQAPLDHVNPYYSFVFLMFVGYA